jgi:protein TonB
MQGEVRAPTLAKRIEPAYTEAAREVRVTGTVHLALVVEDDGTPSSVYLIEGLGFGLDEAATKAVKQWRFNPGTVGGKAVRVQVRIDVAFKLLN